MLRTAFVFGAATFAAGFVFGVIREMVFIPLLGRGIGKWLEFFIMLGMSYAPAADPMALADVAVTEPEPAGVALNSISQPG